MRNSENYEIDDDDDEESRAFYGDEYYSNMTTSEGPWNQRVQEPHHQISDGNEEEGAAFLGDDISFHGANDRKDWIGTRTRIGSFKSNNFFLPKNMMRKAFSLEGMKGGISNRSTPLMCSLPSAGTSFADLAETLQSIPLHSWIMPYIFACSASDVLKQLHNLPIALPPPLSLPLSLSATNKNENHNRSVNSTLISNNEKNEENVFDINGNKVVKEEEFNNLKKASKYVSSLQGRIVVKNGPKLCYKKPTPSPPITLNECPTNYNESGTNLDSSGNTFSKNEQDITFHGEKLNISSSSNLVGNEKSNEVEKEEEEEEEEEGQGFVSLHRPENVFEPKVTNDEINDFDDFSVNYENTILAKIAGGDIPTTQDDEFSTKYRDIPTSIPRTISMSGFAYNYNALPNFLEQNILSSFMSSSFSKNENKYDNEVNDNNDSNKNSFRGSNNDLDCTLQFMKKSNSNDTHDYDIPAFKKSYSLNELNKIETIKKKEQEKKLKKSKSPLTIQDTNLADNTANLYGKSPSSFDLMSLEELKKRGTMPISSSCSDVGDLENELERELELGVARFFNPNYSNNNNNNNNNSSSKDVSNDNGIKGNSGETVWLHAPRPSYAYELDALSNVNNLNSNKSKMVFKKSDCISPPPVIPPKPTARFNPTPSPALSVLTHSIIQPSWRSLGKVWLNKDPTYCAWEMRTVFLCDNYLLECSPDGQKLIGYAQLSGSKLALKTCYFPFISNPPCNPNQPNNTVNKNGGNNNNNDDNNENNYNVKHPPTSSLSKLLVNAALNNENKINMTECDNKGNNDNNNEIKCSMGKIGTDVFSSDDSILSSISSNENSRSNSLTVSVESEITEKEIRNRDENKKVNDLINSNDDDDDNRIEDINNNNFTKKLVNTDTKNALSESPQQNSILNFFIGSTMNSKLPESVGPESKGTTHTTCEMTTDRIFVQKNMIQNDVDELKNETVEKMGKKVKNEIESKDKNKNKNSSRSKKEDSDNDNDDNNNYNTGNDNESVHNCRAIKVSSLQDSSNKENTPRSICWIRFDDEKEINIFGNSINENNNNEFPNNRNENEMGVEKRSTINHDCDDEDRNKGESRRERERQRDEFDNDRVGREVSHSDQIRIMGGEKKKEMETKEEKEGEKKEEDRLDKLYRLFLHARSLTVGGMYDFYVNTHVHDVSTGSLQGEEDREREKEEEDDKSHTTSTSFLGKGCNEVRKGRRREYNTILHTSDNTELKSLSLSTKNTEIKNTTYTNHENGNNIYKAIKLVPKSVFWTRVSTGQERADTLVREVLAQFIVCQPLKHTPLPFSLPQKRTGSECNTVFMDSDTRSSKSTPSPFLHSSLSLSPFLSPSLSPSSTPTPSPPPRSVHPFLPPVMPIVQIFGAYETVDCFALELELMQPTDLFDKLSRDGVFSEKQTQQVVIQLVEAILSCNRHGIAHRDIKLSNITFPIPQSSNKINQQNKNNIDSSNNNLKKVENEVVLEVEKVPSMKKSLSATFLPFQNNSNINNSISKKVSGSGDGQKNEYESDFVFDYGETEIDIEQNNDHNDYNDVNNDNNNDDGNNNIEVSSNNIDLTADIEDDNVYIKLADFGMAGFIGRDGRLRGRCGTPGYVAPDILKAKVNESYSLNVDMFSIGVVAYTLLSGYEPFYGNNDSELITANKTVNFEFHDPEWSTISDSAKDFISQAMSEKATQRITPIKAKNHPWLKQIKYN